jgi:hypothetical protein
MFISATHSSIYDTEEPEFKKEYLDWLGDYPDNEKALKDFITDRFISPNLDRGVTTIRLEGKEL